MTGDLLHQQPGLLQIPPDRVAERLCAVRAKRQPQLQGTKRPGVLERDVDRVAAVLLMR